MWTWAPRPLVMTIALCLWLVAAAAVGAWGDHDPAPPPIVVTSGKGVAGSCPGPRCTLTTAWEEVRDNGTILLTVSATICKELYLRTGNLTDGYATRTIVAELPGIQVSPCSSGFGDIRFLNVELTRPYGIILKGFLIGGFKPPKNSEKNLFRINGTNTPVTDYSGIPYVALELERMEFVQIESSGDMVSLTELGCPQFKGYSNCMMVASQVTIRESNLGGIFSLGGYYCGPGSGSVCANVTVAGLEVSRSTLEVGITCSGTMDLSGVQIVGNTLTSWYIFRGTNGELTLTDSTVARNEFYLPPSIEYTVALVLEAPASISNSYLEFDLAGSQVAEINLRARNYYLSSTTIKAVPESQYPIIIWNTGSSVYNRDPGTASDSFRLQPDPVDIKGCSQAANSPLPCPSWTTCQNVMNSTGFLVGYNCVQPGS